ncbi:hypothetical protein IWX76_000608 [Pedobacter sp. CAN_A7]|uniref:MerC domain-containing protein n=1 Tax=Pedobacter sp. CAN_A7 TaxID=2787722 RepID=UPI0018C9BF04
MKSLLKSDRLDQLGMTASIACAIHCAALPLIITFLPLVGLEFLANIWVEMVMICLSLLIGAWSLISSYSRHENLTPILVLITGFLFIATGHFILEQMEPVLVPLGGFTIAAAHYINWKLNRVCGHEHKS